MSDFEPIHPGRIIRAECLEPHNLSVADAARLLGVTRQALNNVVNGHAGVSPDMALRLSAAFGEDAHTWLHHQLEYDLSQARKRVPLLNVTPVGRRPADTQARLF